MWLFLFCECKLANAMNCDKSHELCFAHELFASEHELANAMKNIARREYKQPLLNEVGVRLPRLSGGVIKQVQNVLMG